MPGKGRLPRGTLVLFAGQGLETRHPVAVQCSFPITTWWDEAQGRQGA